MSGADRARRYRERQRRGRMSARIEVDADMLWALEAAGLLNDHDACDRDKLQTAISTAVNQWKSDIFSSRVTLMTRGRR